MDSGLGSIIFYAACAAFAIAIPILLVELYATSKGKDRRLWSWRALIFGPGLASILLATEKETERQFKKCVHCGKPIRVTAASCPFCHIG